MPLPSIVDVAHDYLFADRDKMVRAGLPEATINHLIRLRDVYHYWLTFPSKKDREIVAELRTRGNIGDTQARDDLRTIKALLGDLARTTKDYHRYRFIEMTMNAYHKAELANNTRDMIAAAAQYAKYTQLDKDDDRDKGYDKIVPMSLTFTDDPEVIGIRRLENHRERIKKKKEQYWNEDIVDVEAEELDFNTDSFFMPNKR
jgi:hypothetical protein